MSYAEATRETIESSMASIQECVEGTQNLENSGRSKRTVLTRVTGFSHMTSLMVSVRQSDRI